MAKQKAQNTSIDSSDRILPTGNEAFVKLLLDVGADRTVRAKDGTAAEIAAEHGHAALVELVLK